MRYFYRHLYDDKNRPIVTICTIENNLTYSRGIAICSPQDIKLGNFSKARGKLIARGRAEKAMEKGKSWGPIETRGWENAANIPELYKYINTPFKTFPTANVVKRTLKAEFPVKLDVEEREFFSEAKPEYIKVVL